MIVDIRVGLCSLANLLVLAVVWGGLCFLVLRIFESWWIIAAAVMAGFFLSGLLVERLFSKQINSVFFPSPEKRAK